MHSLCMQASRASTTFDLIMEETAHACCHLAQSALRCQVLSETQVKSAMLSTHCGCTGDGSTEGGRTDVQLFSIGEIIAIHIQTSSLAALYSLHKETYLSGVWSAHGRWNPNLVMIFFSPLQR